jgi:hypothetical protein
MIAAWQTLAKADLPVRRVIWDPRLLWATLILVGVILVGAAVIAWLDRWRKRASPPSVDTHAQLAHFQELYERGTLSQEEFEHIRSRLSGKLRQELDLPQAPGADEADGPVPPASPP